MNILPKELAKGTLGELFVQLKLLQYGIQAAPPIKDSGNDLIAIKDNVFKAIQVKTTVEKVFSFKKNELPDRYHLLALVRLIVKNGDVDWTNTKIYFLPKENVTKGYYSERQLSCYCLSSDYLNELFQ